MCLLGQTHFLRFENSTVSCFKNRSRLAYIERLGRFPWVLIYGLHSSTFRRMAQFTGIMCLEMWGFMSTPVLKRSPNRCTFFFCVSFIFYTAIYTYTYMPDCQNYVTSLVKNEPFSSCNSCVLILVLCVKANSLFLTGQPGQRIG